MQGIVVIKSISWYGASPLMSHATEYSERTVQEFDIPAVLMKWNTIKVHFVVMQATILLMFSPINNTGSNPSIFSHYVVM